MEKLDNLEELSFEQALRKLEDIVERLTSGDGDLDEMVKLYAEGIRYLNQSKVKLQEAETKVKILSKDLPKLKTTEDEDGR